MVGMYAAALMSPVGLLLHQHAPEIKVGKFYWERWKTRLPFHVAKELNSGVKVQLLGVLTWVWMFLRFTKLCSTKTAL